MRTSRVGANRSGDVFGRGSASDLPQGEAETRPPTTSEVFPNQSLNPAREILYDVPSLSQHAPRRTDSMPPALKWKSRCGRSHPTAAAARVVKWPPWVWVRRMRSRRVVAIFRHRMAPAFCTGRSQHASSSDSSNYTIYASIPKKLFRVVPGCLTSPQVPLSYIWNNTEQRVRR